VLSNALLDKSFWAETIVYASYLISGLSSTAIGGKTPLNIWSGGAAQNYNLLRVFGSPSYLRVKNGEVNPRAKKFIFIFFLSREI